MNTNEFKTYHPIVNFVYFVSVIGFSMFFMHPVFLLISLLSGFIYSVVLRGRKAIKTNILYMLPSVIIMALLNPAFSHEGVSIITYLPSGNPLTIESIIYGIVAAVMIISVICHFSCYNEVMTSDKFIYLFGKAAPSLSLIFSMTLRFVPRFISQFKATADAQRCIGRDISYGGIITRAKNCILILSGITTYALESSVETSDSMKSRGYGLHGRSAFSIFRFDKRDAHMLLCILGLSTYVFIGIVTGKIYFRYYPSVSFNTASIYSASVILAFLILCIIPIIIEFWEVRKWKSIRSKI